jgi:hypothetical protein
MPRKVSDTEFAIVSWLRAHPWANTKQIANAVDYEPKWLSTILKNMVDNDVLLVRPNGNANEYDVKPHEQQAMLDEF